MTATILQFPTQSTQSTQPLSDTIETSFDLSYQDNLIKLLQTEHPFKAARLAQTFNNDNQFDLIPLDIIKQWKKQIKQQMKMNQLAYDYNQMSQLTSHVTECVK